MSSRHGTNQFGPLAALINDPQVTEIMVDGPSQVYVERRGRLEDSEFRFKDNEELMIIIGQIMEMVGRNLDDSQPIADFRLSDGTRVNVVLPPLALNGPVLTLRKYYEDTMTVDDLIRFGSVSAETVEFLKACVKAKLNIVVSGGTASGKTTILNILLSFIPDEERIIVIEQEAALNPRQKRVVRLEALSPNREGVGGVTMRDLLINSLRMRPDRIIIGEAKGGEVLDLMQAMNSGYDGAMTSLHANNPRDALAQLEAMATLDNLSVPILTVRKMMASAIDLVVQQIRLQDGSRKIINITEVQGMQGDLPTLADIFVFEQQGMKDGRIVGRMKPTGVIPSFLERIKATGVTLPPHLFDSANTDV